MVGFAQRFDSLCDALFVEAAATEPQGPCRYIQSHGYHRNRWSAADLDDLRSDRHAETNLAELVANQELLGPYERHMLGEILKAPTKLVMIVGYAGSGKSSTILHVLAHYAAHRHRVAVDTQVRDRFHRLIYYTLRPSHIHIDMQSICEAVEGLPSAEAKELLKVRLAERLPTEIARAIGAAQGPEGSPREVIVDAAVRALDWGSARTVAPKSFRLREAGNRLFQALDRPFGEAPNVDTQYHMLLRGLDRLATELQIEFWHAVIDVIQLALPPNDRLIVVYDNADPMDAPLQVELQQLLHRIANRISHKLVAPVRPVAFKVRSFTGGFSWYPHSGPSPLDVISQRLICFLSQPSAFLEYRTLPNDTERRVVLARTFDILLRIHRGHGRHRSLGRVLSAMAGDSSRRMIMLTRRVFASNALKEDYPPGVGIRELTTIRCRYEYRALVDRLGEALADEMTAVADEIVIDSSLAVSAVAAAAELRMAMVVQSALRNALQIEGSCLRAADPSLLARILSEPDGGGSSRHGVERGWGNVVTIAQQRGFAVAQAEAFARIVIELLKTRHDEMSAVDPIDQMHRLLLGFIREVLEAVLVRGGIEEVTADKVIDDAVERYETDAYCRQILDVNKPYAPAQALLRQGDHAQNLFFLGDEAGPLKLRILYRLAQTAKGSLTVGALTDELIEAGYREPAILAALNGMAGPVTRLLWADRGFEYASYQELVEHPGRPCVLSRSGWGYYHVLLSDIDYSLAMFSGNEPQPLSLTRQLGKVVDGLTAIASAERRHDRERAGRADDVEWQRRTSTALDVAIRVSGQFTYVVDRHVRKIREGIDQEHKLVALHQTLRRYGDLLQERSEQIEDATGWSYTCDRTTENVIFSRSLDPQHRWQRDHRNGRNAASAMAAIDRLLATFE